MSNFTVGALVRRRDKQLDRITDMGNVISIDLENSTLTLKTGTFALAECELVPQVDPTWRNKKGNSSYSS